jgi:hypothetical protein
LTAKVNSSKQRKYLKDLDKESAKIDQQIMSTLRQPKTMTSLTSRNMNSNDSSKHIIAGKKMKQYADILSSASAMINQSNDSTEGITHLSAKTDHSLNRKYSPMNVSSIVRESKGLNYKNKYKNDTSTSFSRNKLLKNKTLPNLMNYNAKASALINSSTRAITKQFMNPTRKYYYSKTQNKTFIEPKTPTEKTVLKNRVYESGSTSRSGGTGEPNYADLKRKARERCMLTSREENDSSSMTKLSLSNSHQNIYASKISTLTKENSKFKSDYEKIRKEMSALEKLLDNTKTSLFEKENENKKLKTIISQKDVDSAKMKKEFQHEREAETKIVNEYINAENYLLELVDEFTNGMRKIYANDIEFKDVDIEGLPFCERFSNLLYNILLIIDFQKQFIVDQQNIGEQPAGGYMNNECIIEEADNEDETDGNNTHRKYMEEESESEEENNINIHNNDFNDVGILSNSQGKLTNGSQYNKHSNRYSKEYSINDNKRNNEQDALEYSLMCKEKLSSNYSSKPNDMDDIRRQYSSDNEMFSEDQDTHEEPAINKTLVMLQKDLHKSLFSPSLMKINESPKVSLLTDRSKKTSQNRSSNHDPSYSLKSNSRDPTVIINSNNPFHKDSIPNIFGLNVRPSSGEVVSPTSGESSRHSIRKDHLSKDNRYQMQDQDFEENNSEEDIMSLESIVIKKENEHKYKNSNNDSIEEAFTPNFITKRSSLGGNAAGEQSKLDSDVFYNPNCYSLLKLNSEYLPQRYEDRNKEIPYDYRPPLVSVLDSEGNRYDEDEFSESIEGSEQMFSSNREDVEELKSDFRFPNTNSTK